MVVCTATSVGQSVPELRAEFALRQQAAQSGTDEDLLELARWAAEHGLIDEADTTYRQILLQQPDHEPAYAELAALWAGRDLRTDSPAYQAVDEALPQFTPHETTHFVIVSDAPQQTVIEHAARLEQTLHEFQRYARRLNLRPLPLRHKLVCVLFASRDEYAAFAQRHDAMRTDWVAGYYAPKHDRVVFYDARHNPGVQTARSDLESARSHVEQARDVAREALRDGERQHAQHVHRQVDEYRRRIEAQQREIDAYAEELATATTLHETTHQLLFHTQVQSPYIEYPLWISEGLATAFESARPNVSFGPDFEFAMRRDEFDALLGDDALLPLAELVTIIEPPADDREQAHVLYHQSYALVTWLNRYRRTELAEYLRAMRRRVAGRLTPAEHLEMFESAFGDLNRLERAWLADENRNVQSRQPK